MTMVLGRYRLQGRLGAGGMAEVWLARASGPSGFEKQVVVKRILPQLAGDATVQELFKTEAKLAARLDHPNLLQVFDFGREPDGALVLVMELIDGTSLRPVVNAVKAGKRLDLRIAAKLMALVCEGLHAAHELTDERGQRLNLVHRDISPENILLSKSGAVKVTDFGIARVEREVQLTAADTFRGKLGYAAPEQLLGHVVNRQADLWAVGVTLFELLTGQRPFVATTDVELATATVHQSPRRVTQLRGDCPLALDNAIARCLSKDLTARWASAKELALELERFVGWSGEPVGSAELGALLVELDIKPHTVSASGTPAFAEEAPRHHGLEIEQSLFEPRAELAEDGSLHPLEQRFGGEAATEVARPTPVQEPVAEAFVPGEKPVALGEGPSDRSNRYARLELLPIAEQATTEPVSATEAAPPPRLPSRLPRVLVPLAVGVALVLAVILVAPRLRGTPPRRPGALFIESTPSGATVLMNGQPVGETPWAGDNPPTSTTLITLTRDGYGEVTLRFDGGVDWSGSVKLQRRR